MKSNNLAAKVLDNPQTVATLSEKDTRLVLAKLLDATISTMKKWVNEDARADKGMGREVAKVARRDAEFFWVDKKSDLVSESNRIAPKNHCLQILAVSARRRQRSSSARAISKSFV
jgi:hypothetical protein